MKLQTLLKVFIPLFVTIDAIGVLPVFIAVTLNMDRRRRRAVTMEAVGAAFVIAIGFMLLGNLIFEFLNITENDFQIAGGILLLVLAVMDLLTRGKPAVDEGLTVGIVPLAMPLIAGPATLTTTLVLASHYGSAPTALALALNFALLLSLLLISGQIARLVGVGALAAISKLVMVLLAAIAVNFIRVGVMRVVTGKP